MQSFSKVSAAQTSCGAYGQFRRRWLHGSLRQASIRTPATLPVMMEEAHWRQKEGNPFTGEVESDALIPADLNLIHLDSPSISVSSPSLSTPMSDRPVTFTATTTDIPLSLGPFVSPPFSPLTPIMMPRTPRMPSTCLKSNSTKYWLKDVRTLSSKLRPGLLDLDVSSYQISPRFIPSATIPSPFRMQLQEDVATTPLPSGTPLTARWPGSGFQRSASRALNQDPMAAEDGAITILNIAPTPSSSCQLDQFARHS